MFQFANDLFGFGSSLNISIDLTNTDLNVEKRNQCTLINNGCLEKSKELRKYEIFHENEDIHGNIKIILNGKKSVEHVGITCKIIGMIEIIKEKNNFYEFFSYSKKLQDPGYIEKDTEYPFRFTNVDMPYDSYYGTNVRLRYFVRVAVDSKSYFNYNIIEKDFIVQRMEVIPSINNKIKMEVGIEECLHIEFEYDKSKYHLSDVIIGKIYFLLVKIHIKYMELSIIRRETVGQMKHMIDNIDNYTDNETIIKYEIMDGSPIPGESVPVRLYLNGMNLTITQRNICDTFSVKYYLNLVLVDIEDRRYFKQQEIIIWRKNLN